MSKVELLCPAGSYVAFEAALYNGADAIFLAGEMYGARANATNFTLEEMRKAVSLAHLYGVKIHVTLNTLIHDDELDQCRAYLKELEAMGVDAIIVQDLGIMTMIQHEFPSLSIHASTQMHVHNLMGVEQCKKWQLERCVVARETPLDEISKMCQQGIEIEVFVQGAYCVSYSGECHMSRSIGHRSANRGECAQSCRLPYTLYRMNDGKEERIKTEGKYLLSMKDLNALPLIPELIECGVASFKIEGRMKRPEYVACMCRIYRQAIDCYYEGKPFDVNEKIAEEMKKVFNRGFTSGYLDKKEGMVLMSTLRPNHQGVRIGKVAGFHGDKMSITLEKELHQHDGIRIVNEKEDQGFIVNYIYKNNNLVSSASNETIQLQKVRCKVGDIVMKTSDSKQLEELGKFPVRKVEIKIKASLKLHQPFMLHLSDGTHEVIVKSENIVENALKTPLDRKRIETQLKKLGNTPFICHDIEIEMDDRISFPISELNECRRKACDELIKRRMEVNKRVLEKKPYDEVKVEMTHQIRVSITNEQQYDVVKQYPCEIYIADTELYEKLKKENSHVHYNYPRVVHHLYSDSGMIHEIGGLEKADMASPYMNCMNAYSAYVLFKEGVKCISLSYECRDEDLEKLISDYQRLSKHSGNFEIEVYGRVENMVLENCLIKSQLHTADHCQQCHKYPYYLKDQKNKAYRLVGDEDCHLKIYHSDIFDKIDRINDYRQYGITNFGVTLTFEDREESKNILNRLFSKM